MRFLAQLFGPALFNVCCSLSLSLCLRLSLACSTALILMPAQARKPAYLQSQPAAGAAPAASPFAIALCLIDGFMAAKLQAFTCNGRVCAALKVMPLPRLARASLRSSRQCLRCVA